jgi:hypothetical protein
MSAQHTYRVYERGDVRAYRFSGRHVNGHPKDLEALDVTEGWFPCPNVNISTRIAREEICQTHHWSRWTADQWHCKKCGVLEDPLKP